MNIQTMLNGARSCSVRQIEAIRGFVHLSIQLHCSLSLPFINQGSILHLLRKEDLTEIALQPPGVL